MINFDLLESKLEELALEFSSKKPFSYVIIDNLCDATRLREALGEIPDPNATGVSKSRDLVFAKNKYESSEFNLISSQFAELKADLLSERFANIVTKIVGESIIIDPDFHGGGLHQGGSGSFLNMHADFNYHPSKPKWFRNINALLYLNDNWKPEYGGQLKLKDGRDSTSDIFEIEPLFNRMVIMHTRDYTLHGYDKLSFPEGSYRRSIAVYGYTPQETEGKVRTTVWYPSDGGFFKKVLGRHMPKLVRIKSAIFGSGTTRNK